MALTGQYIADGAWIKANEATGGAAVRWTSDEALRWINNGQREIVNQSPRANAVRRVIALAVGTRQNLAELGTTAVQLIDVVRNFDSGGTVPGRAITKRERAWFDDITPDWHTDAPAAETRHWMFNADEPLTFYISPPLTLGNKVEVVYAAPANDLSVISGNIGLPDIYGNALEAFVLFSFYSKDASYVKSAALAQSAFQLFMQYIGVRGQNAQTGDQASSQKAV